MRGPKKLKLGENEIRDGFQEVKEKIMRGRSRTRKSRTRLVIGLKKER